MVGTSLTALQAGGVEGGQTDALASVQEALNRGTEELLGQGSAQQAPAGLLQSGEVRHPVQVQEVSSAVRTG